MTEDKIVEPTDSPALVEVEQCDREAALAFANEMFGPMGCPVSSREKVAYLGGDYDSSGIVQAFARHRRRRIIDMS